MGGHVSWANKEERRYGHKILFVMPDQTPPNFFGKSYVEQGYSPLLNSFSHQLGLKDMEGAGAPIVVGEGEATEDTLHEILERLRDPRTRPDAIVIEHDPACHGYHCPSGIALIKAMRIAHVNIPILMLGEEVVTLPNGKIRILSDAEQIAQIDAAMKAGATGFCDRSQLYSEDNGIASRLAESIAQGHGRS